MLARITSENPNFTNLVKLLDAGLKIRDGEDHSFYVQINQASALNCALVFHLNNTAVGCGAFRADDAATVQI